MKILRRLRRGLSNSSIRLKSIVVFASLLLVVLALGVLSIDGLGMVKEAGATISASWMPGVQRAGEISEAANAYRHAKSALVMSPDDDTMAETTKNLTLALDKIKAARAKLAELPTSSEEAGFINGAWQTYLDLSKQIVDLVRVKKLADAADLLTGNCAYQFSKVMAFYRPPVGGKGEGWRRSGRGRRGGLSDDCADHARSYPHCRRALPGRSHVRCVWRGATAQSHDWCRGADGWRSSSIWPTAICRDLAAGTSSGALSRALSVLRNSARERVRLEREAAETRAAADLRQADMERHTQDFGASVSGVMAMLSDTAENIRESASVMTRAAESTRDQTNATTSGAVEAVRISPSVAAAAEELGR